jgi:hypothetical protein
MTDPVEKLKNKLGGTSGVTAGQVYVGKGKGAPQSKSVGVGGISYYELGDTETAASLKSKYYADPLVEAKWSRTLSKYGYGNVDPLKAAAIYELAVDGASDWYVKSKGSRLVTPEQYLQWYAKNQGVGDSNKPKVSVQKYLFQPEEIQSLIDDTLKSVLGRKATDSENKEFYTAIQGMINAGTVTTTKKVGGKTVTETKPGYTKEKAQALIKKSVEEKAPQDLAEKQSLDFADFLSGLGG